MPLGSSSAAPVITPGPRTFSSFLIQEYTLRSTDLCSFPKAACPRVGLVSVDASASEPLEFWEVLIPSLYSQRATQMDACAKSIAISSSEVLRPGLSNFQSVTLDLAYRSFIRRLIKSEPSGHDSSSPFSLR